MNKRKTSPRRRVCRRLHSVVLRCESCGKRAKAPGPSAIASRGYWWHRPCAKMWDADTVDFPSDGKLCPRTILTQNFRLTPARHGVQAAVGERTLQAVADDGHAKMHREQGEGPAVDPITGRPT